MSYLYSLEQGSLEGLRAEVDRIRSGPFPTDEYCALRGLEPDEAAEMFGYVDEDVRILDIAVHRTHWEDPFSPIDKLDWHEYETLLDQVGGISEAAGKLVIDLFEGPPLDIRPDEWGYHGSLEADSVDRLRSLLEPVVGAAADRLQADPRAWDEPLTSHRLVGPARVLAVLRPVAPGKDVIVGLG
ncbi:hypothetical protein ACQBAU_03720 [Propionibacteriaceae bacterium Y2011]